MSPLRRCFVEDKPIGGPGGDVRGWLADLSRSRLGEQAVVLAYARDGVFWGTLASGLVTLWSAVSGEDAEPDRLCELHVFASGNPAPDPGSDELALRPGWQVHAWRASAGTWMARELSEAARGDGHASRDDRYLLVGTEARESRPGRLECTAEEASRHWIPWSAERPDRVAPALVVRHYFEQDDTGYWRPVFYRMLSLELRER
jgi:hypothetical protein